MLHPIIQINPHHHIGEVVDLFFVHADLLCLRLQLLELFLELDALGGGSGGDAAVEVGDGGAVTGLLLVDIVGAHTGDGVRLVAVHINQSLEAVLFAAVEEPVDGAFLVDLQVVGVEVVQEVAADDVARGALTAEGVGDEAQVLLQRLGTEDGFHPLDEATGHIVVKVFIVADGDDIILIRHEGAGEKVRSVLLLTDIVADKGGWNALVETGGIGHEARLIGLPGEDEPRHIEGIPPEHTADGVGDEAADIASEIGAAHGDVLILDLGGQLVLQTVDVDEDAVQFLLVGFELVEALLALTLPQEPAQLERAGYLRKVAVERAHRAGDRGGIPPLIVPFDEGVLREIPGGFKGVPVHFRRGNIIIDYFANRGYMCLTNLER